MTWLKIVQTRRNHLRSVTVQTVSPGVNMFSATSFAELTAEIVKTGYPKGFAGKYTLQICQPNPSEVPDGDASHTIIDKKPLRKS